MNESVDVAFEQSCACPIQKGKGDKSNGLEFVCKKYILFICGLQWLYEIIMDECIPKYLNPVFDDVHIMSKVKLITAKNQQFDSDGSG